MEMRAVEMKKRKRTPSVKWKVLQTFDVKLVQRNGIKMRSYIVEVAQLQLSWMEMNPKQVVAL